MNFEAFPKIPRLKRGVVITEKIDGSNAQIGITDDGKVFAGSRSRWLQPGKETDNFGFAAWVEANKEDLLTLGPGRHFGEWWGAGIQRRYGLTEKRFSLFNSGRWSNGAHCQRPACCDVVPVLFAGDFSSTIVDEVVARLKANGSAAQPGFMQPEGVVVYLPASGHLYKVLCDNDNVAKGEVV
jgi:hypothetical protein